MGTIIPTIMRTGIRRMTTTTHMAKAMTLATRILIRTVTRIITPWMRLRRSTVPR